LNPPVEATRRPASAGAAKTGPISLLDLVDFNNPQSPTKTKPKDKFGLPSPTGGVQMGPPKVPDHVINEKQALRFYGQFSEQRPWESNHPLGAPKVEKEIIRHVTITYYIEDDTINMSEGGGTNGMAGGTFYKRAQLRKSEGTFYSAIDLAVGNVLEVLGQQILIYDADQNTRDYFR
jgi:hypothetical protein